MIQWFKLDGKKPVPCSLLEAEMQLRDRDSRRVNLTDFDNIRVSTVFLCLNHAWDPTDEPELFECMVFRDGEEIDMARCATWEQAEEMHEGMVFKHREKH